MFGDGEHDQALADGWRDFCRRLEEAGMRVFKDQNPPDPLQRADGFRYLTQNLGQAFDLALETRHTRYPAFHHFVSPSRKLGSDNADAVYLQAWIDGASVYRVSGRKGSARFWNFTIQGPRPATAALHDPFGDIPEANILGHELVTDDDGRFELFIGGGRQGANWLPTTPGSRKIFFRQFFDRWDEEPAQIAIERVDMAEPRPLPTSATMIEAMRWAGDFAFNAVDQWPDVLWRSGLIDPSAINRFAGANLRPGVPLSPEEEAQELRRGRVVTQMHWRLEPDQALILRLAGRRQGRQIIVGHFVKRLMRAEAAEQTFEPDSIGHHQVIESLGQRRKETAARREELRFVELRHRAVKPTVGPAVVTRHALEMRLHGDPLKRRSPPVPGDIPGRRSGAIAVSG